MVRDNLQQRLPQHSILAAANTETSAVRKTVKSILIGGVTGGFEVCISYPSDYIKTQLQLDEKGDRRKFKGISDCIKKTYQQSGFFGFYRGLSVLIYGSIPKAAARFGAFEGLKTQMVNENNELSSSGKLFCGLVAGICESVVAVTPTETIKVKFIHDRRLPEPQYKSFVHGVSTIIKTEGWGGVYKGVVATTIKQGTNQSVRFYVVETLKEVYRGDDKRKTVPTSLVGLFGIIAGAISVFSNTPLDVVKTRMQGLEATKYRSTWHCITQIWMNEGLLAFYKGIIPRLCRVCLDVSVTFMIYDKIMEWFDRL